jgi:hypothetical protein
MCRKTARTDALIKRVCPILLPVGIASDSPVFPVVLPVAIALNCKALATKGSPNATMSRPLYVDLSLHKLK